MSNVAHNIEPIFTLVPRTVRENFGERPGRVTMPEVCNTDLTCHMRARAGKELSRQDLHPSSRPLESERPVSCATRLCVVVKHDPIAAVRYGKAHP